MTNKEISKQFEHLAKVMELAGENSFKTRTYSNAAFKISKLPAKLADMDEVEIARQDGFGPAVTAKVLELLDSGTMAELEHYQRAIPEGVLDMLQLKGLGTKKIRLLWQELEVDSLGALAYACGENRLLALKGFGAKTQDSILQGIAYLQENEGKYLYGSIAEAVETLSSQLQEHFEVELVAQMQRQMPVIDEISYITSEKAEKIAAFFSNKKIEVQLGIDNVVTAQMNQLPIIKVYCVSEEMLLQKSFELNGSEEWLAAWQQSTVATANAKNEAEIFSSQNKSYLPAPRREMINWQTWQAATLPLPSLENDAIKGLIHCHSTYSDGAASIEGMAMAAIEQGMQYMVLTDHSQAAFYANGLTPERIISQHTEINKLNEKLAPFKIFKGIEADILYDGSLDYSESIWQSMDLIIASVHSHLKMNAEKATERILNALDNKYIGMLGHPTGRLLLSRPGYPVDLKKVIDKCALKGIAIEINANPRRLDMDWQWVNYALEQGVLLSINPDAHSTEGIGLVKYGVSAAQKTLLTADKNISSFSLAEFELYLSNRKKRQQS